MYIILYSYLEIEESYATFIVYNTIQTKHYTRYLSGDWRVLLLLLLLMMMMMLLMMIAI